MGARSYYQLSHTVAVMFVGGILIVASHASAAITYDNSYNASECGTNPCSTFSYPYTVTSTPDTILFVYTFGNNTGADTVTGVTYGGVSMTKVATTSNSTDLRVIDIWCLANPMSGTNTTTISNSAGQTFGESISYAGAAQTCTPDATDTQETGVYVTSQTSTLTTTKDNDWAVLFARANVSPPIAGTHATQRQNDSLYGMAIFDTNGVIHPAQTYSMSYTATSGTPMDSIMLAFAPDGTLSLSSLKQYKSDATTTIGEGSTTTESKVIFGAILNSSSTTGTLQLQVEVEPSSTLFTNTVTVTSTFVSSGTQATAVFPASDTRESLGDGQFHWQARVFASSTDETSAWQQPFGSNATGTDFAIDTVPLYTQVTSTYPSNSTSSGTGWWAPQFLDNNPANPISTFGCAITSVVMDLRSYGITTTTMNSYMSSTDVDPANINDWLENYSTTTTSTSGYSPPGSGLLNWQDIPYYSETPSGTFTVSYNDSVDHIGSPSSTWVNNWLNDSSGTVPVILTIPTSSSLTVQHFIVATGFAQNSGTSTYTIRDPFFFNTQYLNQTFLAGNGTSTHSYSNTYQGAHVFEPTSTTQLPLYLEYAIDGAHTLMITDPNGKRLGVDPSTGIAYSEIPNSGEDDDEPGVHFLTIYTPIAGHYSLTVGGSGTYSLYSFVADGKHRPIPQVISSSTSAGVPAIYNQVYSPANLAASTVH